MLQSHVIDIDGAFVGAAVRLDIGYRFIATDMRLDELDGRLADPCGRPAPGPPDVPGWPRPAATRPHKH